ncbi:MAG TPA: nickel-dependent hydrogenase large subunit [bacterium]|nr:nickel-dependent hydrogenase large subunit [bacterium]HEX68504.1 nickel-dependent hydrogenase large subunit [bacterium]
MRIVIDPLTRIEGHMGIEVEVEDGVVKRANCSGTLFRGFEIILKGRDPRDANRLTQRICGVCPATHAYVSSLCLDNAFGITEKIPLNGRLVRNLILGCNFLQSHILHFYHLALLDYLNLKDILGEVYPFYPSYEGDYRLSPRLTDELASHYLRALEIRKLCHEMLAIWGGKMPHSMGIIPGGVTALPTPDRIHAFRARLKEVEHFVKETYLADVILIAKSYEDYFEIGKGVERFLCYGGFEEEGERFLKSGVLDDGFKLEELEEGKIVEDVRYSWFEEEGAGAPIREETLPSPDKEEGYSFIKSPRYNNKSFEVGPLARMLINYKKGNQEVKDKVDEVLKEVDISIFSLPSVMGRHLMRAVEAWVIVEKMQDWLEKIHPNTPAFHPYSIPQEGEGVGLGCAPRGANAHWISIVEGKINRYQVVTPTAWNASPKDSKGNPGPIEKALQGTKVKDANNPFEIVRIVRSFDPCLACAVHLINASGKEIGKYRIV